VIATRVFRSSPLRFVLDPALAHCPLDPATIHALYCTPQCILSEMTVFRLVCGGFVLGNVSEKTTMHDPAG
jgi:hypothetical protein